MMLRVDRGSLVDETSIDRSSAGYVGQNYVSIRQVDALDVSWDDSDSAITSRMASASPQLAGGSSAHKNKMEKCM